MDGEKEMNRIVQIVAGILAFVGIVGLYFNLNSVIGMFFDYKRQHSSE